MACSYTAALYCDQTSGRIAQTKFAGERNLDLNQECPCTVVIEGARVNVRFGSKADIGTDRLNVRFTPKSGHWNPVVECPLCAKSGHQFNFEVGASGTL